MSSNTGRRSGGTVTSDIHDNSTVDGRMHNFMREVRDLTKRYGMDVAVVGLATTQDGDQGVGSSAGEGFTSFGAVLRDGELEIERVMTRMDAVRNDIREVYEDVARDMVKGKLGPEGLSIAEKIKDALEKVRASGGQGPLVVHVGGDGSVRGGQLGDFAELVKDMQGMKKKTLLN